MLGVVALLLVPLLAVPSLLVVVAIELSTPSPVYFDLTTFRFKRHKQYERTAEAEPAGGDFAARAAASYQPPSLLTEDEAAVALAVQLSLDAAAEAAGVPEQAGAEPPADAPHAAVAVAPAAAQLAPASAREEAPAGGGEADAEGPGAAAAAQDAL